MIISQCVISRAPSLFLSIGQSDQCRQGETILTGESFLSFLAQTNREVTKRDLFTDLQASIVTWISNYNVIQEWTFCKKTNILRLTHTNFQKSLFKLSSCWIDPRYLGSRIVTDESRYCLNTHSKIVLDWIKRWNAQFAFPYSWNILSDYSLLFSMEHANVNSLNGSLRKLEWEGHKLLFLRIMSTLVTPSRSSRTNN